MKLDNPKGAYYGGLTAAPGDEGGAGGGARVARRVARPRHARGEPAGRARSIRRATRRARADARPRRSATRRGAASAREAPARSPPSVATADTSGTTPFVATLPAPKPREPSRRAPRPVPDVRGLSLREAVRALHAAGFRVRLARRHRGGTRRRRRARSRPWAPSVTPDGRAAMHTRRDSPRSATRCGRAGLLVGEPGTLPDHVDAITDDSRAVQRRRAVRRRARRRARRPRYPRRSRRSVARRPRSSRIASRTTLPALVVRDTRRAAAVAAAGVLRRARARAAAGRRHRHERQDDHGRHAAPPARRAAAPARRRSERSACSSAARASAARRRQRAHDAGAGRAAARAPRAARRRACARVAMEMSSHALHQRRVEGLALRRRRCSRTSRATISTITARWRRTSPPRRCSID